MWMSLVEKAKKLKQKKRTENKQRGEYKKRLGGGFKYCLFSPQFGEDSHFD